MKKWSKTGAVAVLLVGFVITFSVFCHSDSSNTTATNSLLYLNHHDTAKYVGINTCKQCHSAIYESFIQTGMGQSFAKATRTKSAARFTGHNVVYDKFRNFYYQPYWVDSTFYIKEYRLAGKDTVFARTEKVNYIIGSGQHTNSHMMEINGYFYQMPLTFYTQKQRWDLPPGYDKGGNLRFGRTIELECMSCHNAYPNFVEGSLNKFASVPQGIDCERCHGPGSIHVQQKQLGNIVDTATHIDYTIVNPKKLPYQLQVDVCQRCHLQGNTVLAPGKSFFDFKPGMQLSKYMSVFLPQYTTSDEFIMASHAERLKSSQCFVQSTKKRIQVNNVKYVNSKLDNTDVSSLTCISCHNPHKSVKFTDDAQFNTACKNCHSEAKKYNLPLCSEKLNTRKALNDNCQQCHMPKSGSIDIPHVRITDHRIQIPLSGKKKEAIKQFLGLKALNNPIADAETIAEGYISYFEKYDKKPFYLDSAEIYLIKSTLRSLRHTGNWVRLHFLREDYPKIVKLATDLSPQSITDSWTAYRIGRAFEAENTIDKAYLFLKQAVVLAKYNLDFNDNYAIVAIKMGYTTEAKSVFEFILAQNPTHVNALNNLGYLNLTLGQVTVAEKLYNAALAIDPDYEPLLLNKVGFYLYVNQPQKAKKLLQDIIRKNPKNIQAKQVLGNL